MIDPIDLQLLCARHAVQRMVEAFEDLDPKHFEAWKQELVKHLVGNDSLKLAVVGAVAEASEEIVIPYINQETK